MDVYRNTRTHSYDIDISMKEWKEILTLPEVQNDKNMLPALEKWCFSPCHTSSCKALGAQYGHDFRFYSVQNHRHGQIAARFLKRYRLLGDEGREIYWASPWIELKKVKGVYNVLASGACHGNRIAWLICIK